MIRRQGTRVTVYRGTPATAADGNRYLGAPWAVRAEDLHVNIQEPTAERVATVWGTDFPIDAVAFASAGVMAEEDRLDITAGPFVGEKYAVTKVIRHRMRSSNDHDELALQSTSEVFA